MEKTVSKRANRDSERLLMARLGEYRQFVEERELIEEALMMLEHKSVNFWKTGMRIGNDLLGLTLPMPSGGPREIERLRRFEEKDGAHVPGDTDYRHAKREQLKHIISALDPFYGVRSLKLKAEIEVFNNTTELSRRLLRGSRP